MLFPDLRAKLFQKLIECGFDPINVIHPSAVIAAHVQLGRGVVIMANAVVNVNARLGDNVVINTAASVDHDDLIGDHAQIWPGAHLAGSVTVGAFYRRFPDKDALLHLLDERFFREMQARADELLDPNHWQGASISEILSEFARTAVNVYTARRGVARSLFLRARVDPVIQATARQVNARCIERLRALLLDPGRRAEVTHLDPDRAIALGFMMFFGALRETTVFGEVWPEHRQLVGDDLGDEMARLYLAYLGVRPLR